MVIEKEVAMVNSQNTDDQIVYHLPRYMRVVGRICIAVGIFFLAIGMVGGWGRTQLIPWICLIIGFTLPGLFLYTYTAEWTFDQSSGYITVTRGSKPFPRLTTRISRTDVQSVNISTEEAGGYPECKLSIKTSKRKLKLTMRDEQTADYLAARIRDFARSP